jgi:hypothetical protein
MDDESGIPNNQKKNENETVNPIYGMVIFVGGTNLVSSFLLVLAIFLDELIGRIKIFQKVS